MIETVPTLVNGMAISLEIAGFVLMLFSSKRRVPKGFKVRTNVAPAPQPNLYLAGIILIIIGLAGQIGAMFA